MRIIIVIFLLSLSTSLVAKTNTEEEKPWGLGFTVRSASIPFDTIDDKVNSVVPMMFYEGDTFFLRGIEGGAHLLKNNDWEINTIGRLRFVDFPFEYQNQIQADTFDLGVQWRKNTGDDHHFDIEAFSDLNGRPYAKFSSSWYFENNSWEFMPTLSVRYKSAEFNSHYYALTDLTDQNIGAGFDINAIIESRYHVVSNFYLIGSLGITGLDNNAYQSSVIDKRWQSEAYIGIGLFNDKTKQNKDNLSNGSYLRVAHGWATPSNIGDIIRGDTEKDEFNNQLTSVFYGVPLTDELFNLPLEIYLTTGVAWHWKSDVQDSEQEYQIAIKAYYTISWPVRWRLGFAEGLSYISDVTYIERTEMEEKGYRPSKLMNAIDLSLDINLGDVFNANALKGTWLGYGIHHRSSIFESASQYGRIKGGSNYNTIYLQFDF
jgi:outer membrane protein